MSVPLKRLATVIAGQSPASDDVSELGEGLPFIQGNAEFGARTPTPKWQCDVAPKVALPGDVLVSVRAPVGATNMATMPLGIGRGVAAIRAWRADPDYLYWFVSSSSDLLNAKATGSTFTAVTAADLASLEVPVTDPEEQQRIADYLDRETAMIDTLIEKQRQLRSRLGERRQAVIDAAFLGVKGFAPLRSHLYLNDSGAWGEEPTGQEDTEVLRSTEQTVDGYWSIDDPAPRHLNARERIATKLLPGDLVVTKTSGSRKHMGKTTLVTPEIAQEGYGFGNFMQRLRTRPSLDPHFLWWFFRSDRARRWIGLVATTSTGLMNLNGTTLGRMEVPVPPLEEQRAIADRLDRETATIDALIAKAERFIELAQERRAALITAAVTGQLEIPAEESAA